MVAGYHTHAVRNILIHDYGCIRDRKNDFAFHHPIGRIRMITQHFHMAGYSRDGTLFVLFDPYRHQPTDLAQIIDAATCRGYKMIPLAA